MLSDQTIRLFWSLKEEAVILRCFCHCAPWLVDIFGPKTSSIAGELLAWSLWPASINREGYIKPVTEVSRSNSFDLRAISVTASGSETYSHMFLEETKT